MSTTSGDPRNLNQFLEGSEPLRGQLTESARAAVKAAQAFAASGSVAGGSLGGLQAMIQLLSDMGANEAFVHSITEALAAADRGGMGPVTVSDATLAAKLKADGVGAAPSYIVVSPSSLLGFPPTSGFVDDPVCALTGNFFHAEVDLSFPARASLLDLARHYNSLASARVGSFGPGWSSLLDMALVAGAGEGIVVSLADGAEVGFSAGDDGVLRPETRPQLSLSHLDDGTWVLADGVAPGATRWRFDAAGTLTAISRGSAQVALERSGGEVARLVEASSGRWVALSWEGGHISSASSSDGREVAYAYDAEGHLVGVARPSGSVSYRIEAGLVAAVVDADGVSSVSNVYDEAGRVMRQRSAFGRVSAYTYSDHGLTVVAGEGGTARNAFVHDRRGNLTTMVDADGRPQRLRYDADGRLVGLSERRGGTWETTWDPSGSRPARRVGPEGFEESFEWDGQGRIVAHHLGPPGSAATTRWSYASPEHTTPSLIVEPGGARTVIEVSGDDLATSITDADGVRAEMAYDADGQMTSLRDALGNTTRLAYDPYGNLAAWRFPSSITLSYDSDEAGRVLRAVTPKARWSYEWSAAGRALAGVDPAEGPWRARHGEHGALSSITDPAGGETSFSYDAYGRPLPARLCDRPRGGDLDLRLRPRGRAGRHRRADGGGDPPCRRPARAHDGGVRRRGADLEEGLGTRRASRPGGRPGGAGAVLPLRRRGAPRRGHRRRRGARILHLVAGGAAALPAGGVWV
ncbi:MAG: RHS repeat protein [Actinobacteria bacterium]|nr:MAG: RHS repeat protein [Actinomycetota bacterium]